MKRGALGLMGVFLAIGCSAESRTETWNVSAHRAPCMGFIPSLCLLVSDPGSSQPSFHYDGIAGLTPRWGHEYTVDVLITPVADPPADGSSLDFKLLRIRRDEAVPAGTTFPFVVMAATPGLTPFLSLAGSDAGQLLDGTPFVCPAGSGVCADIATRLSSGARFEITFAHGDGALTALAVADPR